PAAGSEITLLYSTDSGMTWTSGSAIPSTTADPLHFHPALSLAQNGNSAYVGYYVQQANEQIRTDLAVFQLADKKAILKSVCSLSSVAFALPPNNIPDPDDLESTVNYDQILVPGYSLGEYMGVTTDDSGVAVCAWGDSRQTWDSPVDSYSPGSHPQADVFFRKLSVK
ncbi:MAG: hypothetical protein JWM99_4860, partial [Verrucomicrobiales bacterium]|nr:hypothetical protein [Verrucomicrobiales bacterium]